jgi:hypothetical protein
MILKVTLAQPVFDNSKQDPHKSKEGLKRKETTSFASILENTIKSQNY